MENIRNFCIIAHIDSGKSTLADRFLEVTHTVEQRNMRPQYLDKLDLERERGITIKMAPVRMHWKPSRGSTQINADSRGLLYEDITYKVRGALFNVYNALGPGHKEAIYQNALRLEFVKAGVRFEREKRIDIIYEGEKVGLYQPDFVVEGKVVLELKALPFLGDPPKKQARYYLRGSSYKLALLANFGARNLEIERIIYDVARHNISENLCFDPRASAGSEFILNLIDTPGHSDFSYEVSRALAAVEGAILLVDATKGIQAQTLSTLRAANKAGLKIIGAVNKVDLFRGDESRIEKMAQSIADLIRVSPDEIFRISAKTGEGVEELLAAVVKKVPPPTSFPKARESLFSRTVSEAELEMNERSEDFLVYKSDGRKILSEAKEEREPSDLSKKSNEENIISRGGAGSETKLSRALIFDSLYDDHKGIIAFVRVFDGEFEPGEEVELIASGAKFKIKEVGFFSPEFKPAKKISSGEIGYIATGVKEPALVKIGDTILTADIRRSRQMSAGRNIRENQHVNLHESANLALPGYHEPAPVVFISFYPDGKTEFEDLRRGFERLRLNDAALSFEPDANDALGRGLKAGFLGQLHFEITAARLEREFNLEFLTSFPSIAYKVLLRKTADDRGLPSAQICADKNQRESAMTTVVINQPQDFPDKPERVWQPMIKLEIISPKEYLSQVAGLKNSFDVEVGEIKNLGENLVIEARMPLAELIRDFDDRMKSASAGFASFSYELDGEQEAEVEKLEILIVGEPVPALTRVVAKKDVEREGRKSVEKLKELLPKEQFSQAIQAKAAGRIIARETIPAMKKLLGNFGKTGGDRTRKMKLWKKQRRGKEKLQEMARVELSPEVFREILKK